MPYALLDDGFYDHPKVMDLMLNPDVDGKGALAMWPIGLSWAHRHTIDKEPNRQGVIPRRVIESWDRLFGGVFKDAEALADAGLWDRMPDGAYRIHDFRHWAHLDTREAKQRAGRASAHKRWGTPLPGLGAGPVSNSTSNRPSNTSGNTPSNSASNTPSNNVAKCVSNPQDQDQVQDQHQGHQKPPSSAHPADADFDAFWSTYPRRIGKQAARRAWNRCIKYADPQVLIKGAVAYAELREDQDPKFTAHPATWLNHGRWDDEPDPGHNSAAVREVGTFE